MKPPSSQLIRIIKNKTRHFQRPEFKLNVKKSQSLETESFCLSLQSMKTKIPKPLNSPLQNTNITYTSSSTSHFQHLSISLAMAVLCLIEGDNKENVPPFFSCQAMPLAAKSPLSTINKGRARKPLEDITNLFNQSILVPHNGIPIFHSLSSPCKAKYGKRRAEDGVDSTYKKTQLVYLGKNFR